MMSSVTSEVETMDPVLTAKTRNGERVGTESDKDLGFKIEHSSQILEKDVLDGLTPSTL